MADVASGRFREDLYYRLNVVGVRLPPLAERPEDVPLLIRALLERHSRRIGCPVPEIEPAAHRALLDHVWPGNVRELENALERAMVLARGGVIRRPDLPHAVLEAASPPRPRPAGDISLKKFAGAAESEAIRAALERSGGNRREAAALLGISVRTLFYKLKELGISE